MFRFLCTRQTTLLLHRHFSLINSTTHLGSFQTAFFTIRLLSSSPKAIENDYVTVSYLMNSCGLSLESSISTSKKVKLIDIKTTDSVLTLLSSHGFTNTQISQIVRLYPQVLVLNPEETILPKIEFLSSIGFSRNDLTSFVSKIPFFLGSNLKKRIVPNYNILKNVLSSDENVIKVMKRLHWNFFQNLTTTVASNISFLKEIDVPQSMVSAFLTNHPAAACCEHSKFCKVVNSVKEMGFSLDRVTFVIAVAVIIKMKKSVWESKFDVFGRWDWSKDDTLAAFKKHPQCMLTSEEKIAKVMDFLVNKMGWVSQDIVRMPYVLLYSLEKRIVPRCSVVQVLLSKGLINEDISPSTFLCSGESKFIDRYVTKFQKEVPQLLNVYKGKFHLLDVNSGFKSFGNVDL